jgi:hypothetical protein
MSSWITVPMLPDSMVKALRRGRQVAVVAPPEPPQKKQAAAAAKSAPAAPAPTPVKPACKVTPYYTGARAEGPAGFLRRQAENPPDETSGPKSFAELSELIYGPRI